MQIKKLDYLWLCGLYAVFLGYFASHAPHSHHFDSDQTIGVLMANSDQPLGLHDLL